MHTYPVEIVTTPYNYDGCKSQNSHSVTIMGFLLMSAFLRPVLGGLGQFLYMHFLDLALGIRFEPVLGGLSRLKEIASHTSMQMVRSNEKNNMIYSSSMSEQMRNVEPHARLSGSEIIYPNSMNREDLSKMSKDELINMLLGKQTVSANKARTSL